MKIDNLIYSNSYRKTIFPKATIVYREDGIVHIHNYDGLLSLDECKNIFYSIKEYNEWGCSPVLITGNIFPFLDKNLISFYGSAEVEKHCSSIVMVCDGLGQIIVANFFIELINMETAIRFFISKKEAFNWLKTIGAK